MRTTLALVLLPLAFLAGCSASFAPTTQTDLVTPTAIHGTVHGGQQPVASSHLYVYAAATTGYGAASASLLNSVTSGSFPTTQDSNGNYYVTTDAYGNFNISNAYSCTPGTQVYIYSVGGNPGAGTNSAVGLMALLGQCPSNGTFAGVLQAVYINEMSTVAAAYALAGYAVDATHIATSGSALATTGIANAALNAANLYNIGNPMGPLTTTPSGNGAVPTKLINTIANILATCINSTGSTSSSCTTLFNDARQNGTGGTQPTDTATAAINIAHNPGTNVTALFNLQTSSVPYTNDLTTAPNDFTIGITYSGFNSGTGTTPNDITIDASGNVWVTNSNSTVSELSTTGVPATGSPFAGGNGYLAIDTSNNVWVTSTNSPKVVELAANGAAVSGSPFIPSGTSALTRPGSVAIDSLTNIYIADQTNNIVDVLTSSGAASSSSPFNNSCLSGAAYTAVDGHGNIWAASPTAGAVCQYKQAGTYNLTETGLGTPGRMGVDKYNDILVPDKSSNGVYKVSITGSVSGPYTGGGLNKPFGAAIDGNDMVWIANTGNNSVTVMNINGTITTPSTGYTGGSMSSPTNLAVDGSGNVWLTNPTANTLTQLVGAAAPIITPLAAASQITTYNLFGTKP